VTEGNPLREPAKKKKNGGGEGAKGFATLQESILKRKKKKKNPKEKMVGGWKRDSGWRKKGRSCQHPDQRESRGTTQTKKRTAAGD